MSKTSESKLKLKASLEEIFGPLSEKQNNIAKCAFEDPESWMPKLRAMKKDLWQRQQIQNKGWDKLNKPERIKVQRIKGLKKQIQDLKESVQSPIEELTFEVRINRLPSDMSKESLEDELRKGFAKSGDIVKFDWLSPKTETPHGHMGDVYCHFASLKEKFAAMESSPFRHTHDPTLRLLLNSEIDVDPIRTCLLTG